MFKILDFITNIIKITKICNCLIYCFCKFLLHFRRSNVSNIFSPKLHRLGTRIKFPELNMRSTGADDGRVVLYLRNIFLTMGNASSMLKSVLFDSKYAYARDRFDVATPDDRICSLSFSTQEKNLQTLTG